MPKVVKKTTEKEHDKSSQVTYHQEGGDSDERRLFYVALTRAKESVTITHAKAGDDGRELLPSGFIEEIKSDLVEKLDTEEWEEKFKNDLGFQYKTFSNLEVEKSNRSLLDKEFINDLFEKQGLSPTALNNYLDCPWKYFYQNLIRIPSAYTKHQSYGTAVHGALSDFFEQMKKEDVGKEYLLASFEGWMNKQSFDPRDFKETFNRGVESLGGWYDTYAGTWNLRTQTEHRINGILLSDGTKLTGVLDKIEWNDDDSVNVVDYKTGKPKTRNALMGQTKDADGNYHRQLIFYKLLLKYYREGEYHMREGVIDFIEPDDKGKYHKEVFEISDEQVIELEETILRVSDEIRNLAFLDKGCREKECEFCGLRKLL
jgi:DNA helicase II / ATP-dependent DNA helicase PcrA